MSKVISVIVKVLPDEDPDTSYLDQKGFEDRLTQFKRGHFNFVGVRAEAEVEIAGVVQEITSGGLWGIESDSEASYFREVGKEEYSQLKDVLAEMGIGKVPPYAQVRVKWFV